MSDAPVDVGVLLKKERELKGISLDVVHEATKVPLDSLKAIEEGYKVRTLTAFYYKSFVKIYAQYLGLDAAHIVSLIPTHHPKPSVPSMPVKPADSPVRTAQRGPATGSGPHRVDGVRSWNLLSHPIILKKKKKFLKATLILIAVVGLVFLVGFFVRKAIVAFPAHKSMAPKTAVKPSVKKIAAPLRIDEPKAVEPKSPESRSAAGKTVEPKAVTASVDNRAQDKKNNGKTPKVVPAVQETSAAVNTGHAIPEPSAPTATAPSASVRRVSMTVKAETGTWISVRVDGTSVFQGRLKKGSSESWHASKKIEISAKDIGALEFEVNGRSVGKLARSYLKAKKVVVTTEGLNVEK